MDTYYIGTDLRFLFEITAEGFSQDSSTYNVKLKCGGVDKPGTIVTSNNAHYLIVDTAGFCAGVLTAKVTAQIPDASFTSGYRREVQVVELCYLRDTP